jgi:hypothetical protein
MDAPADYQMTELHMPFAVVVREVDQPAGFSPPPGETPADRPSLKCAVIEKP